MLLESGQETTNQVRITLPHALTKNECTFFLTEGDFWGFPCITDIYWRNPNKNLNPILLYFKNNFQNIQTIPYQIKIMMC
jgi:hypothetical protein